MRQLKILRNLILVYCVFLISSIFVSGQEPDTCGNEYIDSAVNLSVQSCFQPRNRDGMPVNSVCYANDRVVVETFSGGNQLGVRGTITEPVADVRRLVTEPFDRGFQWGIAAFRFPGNDPVNTDSAITMVAYGGTQITDIDLADGVIRLNMYDLDDDALDANQPTSCERTPGGVIIGVQDETSGTIFINGAEVQMQSRAYVSFGDNDEINIINIEGNITVTVADEEPEVLDQTGDFVSYIQDTVTGTTTLLATGGISASAIDRLSFDPYLLFVALEFEVRNPPPELVNERSAFGSFLGLDPANLSTLSYAIQQGLPSRLAGADASEQDITTGDVELAITDDIASGFAPLDTSSGVTNTVTSNELDGLNDFVGEIYFRASPEDGDLSVSVACPDDPATEPFDCLPGGLTNPSIVIFDPSGNFIGTTTGLRRVDFGFKPMSDGIYTLMVSGTGFAPRAYGYCIGSSTSPCPDAVPALDEEIRINFPPEIVPVEPKTIPAGEESIITITAYDPEGLQTNIQLSAISSDPAVEVDSAIVNGNLVLRGITATEEDSPVQVTINALDDDLRESSFTFDVTVSGCQTPAGWVSYTAVAGDTYFNIATRTNITLADLFAGNCIDPDNIPPLVAGTTALFVPFPPPDTPVVTTDIIVNTTQPTIAPDGFCSLAEAILAANSGIPSGALEGECVPQPGGVNTISLEATGTYLYTTSYGNSNALPAVTSTITINGNGNTLQRSASLEFRILQVNGGSLTLNNIVLTGGDMTFGGENGGAVQVNGGTLVFNGTATNNRAVDGGAIANLAGVVYSNGSVINNVADINGGGILNRGTLYVYGTVSGNSASGSGGGISNSSNHQMTISGATLNNNTNAAVANFGMATITGSTFSGNTAGGTAASVLVTVANTTTTLTNNTLTNNPSSHCAGGGVINSSGNIGVDGSC